MAENQTLHSRLRVLVAKTYRAEKLFASIRNTSDVRSLNFSFISDLANDLRSREWQNAHHELRDRLNDILALGAGSVVIEKIEVLREEFLAKHRSEKRDVERGLGAVTESGAREEFAQMLRFSLELIRLKARAQVYKAIADELSGILVASGRRLATTEDESEEGPLLGQEEAASSRGKVVALRPRISSVG
ncbi:MAG: hypothetical protein IT290_01800 [Deltaproteobacteria bacterium]|nr:hypothetical protein [Deltaproteobacteria bacterium]